jgi:phosphoglycolate phosphatase-like HAD superfamily hydrolase
MKAVLFDLDGTLIDSAPQLVGALNQLRQNYDLPPIPFLTNTISNGGSGTYLKSCTFTLPTTPTSVKFTITYNVAYTDANQSNVLIIRFFNNNNS